MSSGDAHAGLHAVIVALCAVALIGLSVAFLDRTASTWSHATFHGDIFFVDLTHIVDPVLPGAALGLVGAAVAVTAGWRPGRAGRTFIACCMAALVAYAIKDQMKFAFGRTWPETWVNSNPSWIRDGVYGFSPFHGGAGWGSFPSGHMAGIAAPMTVLWQRVRRLRWLAVLPTGLVAIGLYGADYHFVSDMIAGTFVGAACGLGVLAALHAGWTDRDEGRSMGEASTSRS